LQHQPTSAAVVFSEQQWAMHGAAQQQCSDFCSPDKQVVVSWGAVAAA
jgi:hypothetical protein